MHPSTRWPGFVLHSPCSPVPGGERTIEPMAGLDGGSGHVAAGRSERRVRILGRRPVLLWSRSLVAPDDTTWVVSRRLRSSDVQIHASTRSNHRALQSPYATPDQAVSLAAQSACACSPAWVRGQVICRRLGRCLSVTVPA